MIGNGNVFAEPMKTVRVCSLGQITKALFEDKAHADLAGTGPGMIETGDRADQPRSSVNSS